jgi:hypothetical protein
VSDRFPLLPEISLGLPPVVAAALLLGAVTRLIAINAGVVLPMFVDQPVAQHAPEATPRLASPPPVSMFDPTAETVPTAPAIVWETEPDTPDALPLLLATHSNRASLSAPDRASDAGVTGNESFRRLFDAKTADRAEPEIELTPDSAWRTGTALKKHALGKPVLNRSDGTPTRYKDIQYFEIDRCVPCTAG